MTSAWNKLKKSLSLRISSQSSLSLDSPPSRNLASDVSETDVRVSTPRSSLSGIRLSRSVSSRSTKKTCAICLGSMRPGQGQAIFTAECSHAFHFNCIASSVKHGNHLCPICRSKWKDIPFQAPSDIVDPQLNGIGRARITPFNTPLDEFHAALHRHLPQQPSPRAEPQHFDDDEPLNTSHASSSPNPLHQIHQVEAPTNQLATVKVFPEFPAVPAAETRSTFAVLVSVKAPSLHENARHRDRAPIDLVTVLDVSGSMGGTKLALLKRAVRFIIRNLGPADRLSIVAFSSTARRIFPLRLMSDAGRDDAVFAINSLVSSGGTNIVEGLKKGVRVLEDRRERNPVARIILLSDGKDTYNNDTSYHPNGQQNQTSLNSWQVLDYLNLLPPAIRPSDSGAGDGARQMCIPVHTFGFGSDHDATAMHAISDVSGGTYSFIQRASIIQDAFARCIGGLLSVVAQELRLTVSSISPGVCIGSIPTGKYLSQIINQGQQGIIDVGDLYADEEKDFLVHLSIPVFPTEESEEIEATTPLLAVECTYKDPLSQEMVHGESRRVEIRRPKVLSSLDNTTCLEVDRQRNRLWVAEGIAEAQGMAEKGNLEGAQSVLANRRSVLLASASAQAGDGLCNWLEAELKEIRERMASQELYEETGRAYVLSGLSSHSWQRATTRGNSTTHGLVYNTEGNNSHVSGGSVGYETPSMVSMVTRSQTLSLPVGNPPPRRLNRSCSLVHRAN